MKKIFYQSEWHHIKFSEFTTLSQDRIADSKFYDLFYQNLFKKYRQFDDLDANWRKNKEDIGNWLSRYFYSSINILSFGCGLGFLEYYLTKSNPNLNLYISDFSEKALKWIKKHVNKEKIITPNLENFHQSFDLIYLSAVDYALDDKELIEILISCRKVLKKDGQIILISASYLKSNKIKILKQDQRWGWLRSRSAYQKIFLESKFLNSNDGFIKHETSDSYFIRAKAS